MYINTINPTLLHLGPLEIRWYGLVYLLGFLLSAYWLQQNKDKLNLSKDTAWDLLFYIFVGLLLGARLFMILWQPQDFLLQPVNLLKIWQGGMSFHGGLLGAVLGAYLYAKRNQLNFWNIADILSLPAILALALGRIANFINGELVGRPFNGQWCVVFPKYDATCRHPSTLYDAIKRLIIAGWIYWLQTAQRFKKNILVHNEISLLTSFQAGFIFWNLMFWEGLGRIIIDFFRENNLFLGLSLGQWLSLGMVITTVIIFKKNYQEDLRKLFYSKK